TSPFFLPFLYYQNNLFFLLYFYFFNLLYLGNRRFLLSSFLLPSLSNNTLPSSSDSKSVSPSHCPFHFLTSYSLPTLPVLCLCISWWCSFWCGSAAVRRVCVAVRRCVQWWCLALNM
ncbi:hypothetical protein V8G54_002014, partial [Vigna mungo]